MTRPDPPPAGPPSGQASAFDRHFAEVADRLLLFVRLRLGAALAARTEELDVLQDVYLEARSDFDGKGEGPFLGWLCTIASHRLADLGRAEVRARVLPAGVGAERSALSRVLDLAADARTGPLTAAARVDARAVLADAIDGLDPEPREVLLAHFFEGKSQARIAADTGRSPSAVQRALAKALVEVGRPLRAAFGPGGAR